MPKISACIVAYCDYDEVCAAVRSILHYTPAPDLTLYVVDNASPDGCGRQLAETDFGRHPRALCLPAGRKCRLRQGPQRCAWIRLHQRACILSLNPDILLTGDVLEADGRVAAGPARGRHGNAPAALPGRQACSTCRAASRRPGCCWRGSWPRSSAAAFKKADDHYTMQDEDLTVPRRIEFCTGSFMAVRTDVLQGNRRV